MSNGSGDKKQLGKILLKQRLVTQAELDELLAEQRTHPGQRLATTAVKSGKVAEVDLLKALSEQHGLPGIDLTQVVIPSDNLKLVPVEIARQPSQRLRPIGPALPIRRQLRAAPAADGRGRAA